MPRKKNIPEGVKLRVLEEAGYQCAYCGHRDGLNLTAHHIKRKRDGGKDTPENLIALCYNCHNRVDETQSIPEKDIRRLKRHLVQQRLTQPGTNVLRIAYEKPFGVVASPYAVRHLIEEKLLKYIETVASYVDAAGEGEMTALYRITPKGKQLVELWVL